MHAPDDHRAVYVYNERHGTLVWEGSRRLWIRTDAQPILFHRAASRVSIRAAIAMQLAVPVSAVELRARSADDD